MRLIKVKMIDSTWFVVSKLGNTMPLVDWYKGMATPYSSPRINFDEVIFSKEVSPK